MKSLLARLFLFIALTFIVNIYEHDDLHAYGRGSHQHITEISYAILKDIGYCQLTPIDHAMYERSIERCNELADESKKSDMGNDFSQEECENLRVQQFWPEENGLCRLYRKIQSKYPPNINNSLQDKGGSTQEYYYREFRAKACPPEELYSYKIEGICGSYSNILIDSGYRQENKSYSNYTDYFDPLQSYTRVQYGGIFLWSKNDNTWGMIDINSPAFVQPKHISRIGYLHLPVRGALLGNTNFIEYDNKPDFVDLTGSILGLYSGATDLYDDMFTSVHIFPLIQDAIKTIGEVAVSGTVTAATAVIMVGAIITCGVASAIDWFGADIDSEKCWSTGFFILEENLEEMRNLVNTIEESNFFATTPTSSTFGHRNTSMFHFMNTPLDYASLSQGLGNILVDAPYYINIMDALTVFFDHDDIDGYRPGDAYGFWLGAAGVAFESLLLDQLLDIRVDYPTSKPALLNYQVINPDDGREPSSSVLGSPFRKVFYWHRQGLLDYTFPPVDNLAYYWWHVWWRARIQPVPSNPDVLRGEEEVGLVPLGSVLHAVQDVTQPLHARGVSVKGHQPYESRLDILFDETLYRINHPDGLDMTKPTPDFILDLQKPDVERQFVEDVVREFLILHEISVKPTGVLQIRELMHELYRSSIEREFELPAFNDPGIVERFLERLFSDGVSDYYTTRIGLVRATAATLLVLFEASRSDPEAYAAALDLTTFENFTPAGKRFAGPEGTVNTLVSLNQGLRPEVSYHDNPAQVPEDWNCAGSLPETQQALRDYIGNQIPGRDLVASVLGAHIHCSIVRSGLPAPPTELTAILGRYKARQLEASTMLLSHGDLNTYAQDMACAQAEEWTDMQQQGDETQMLVPATAFARVQARCLGQLDSDGDGVFDQNDQCFTPPELTHSGAQVNADGCLFDHDYTQGGRVSGLKSIPGAIFEPGGTTP